MSDNRPPVYEENGIWVYRASFVGNPLRCLSAARQGYEGLPPPDYLIKAAEAGDMAEIEVKAKLRNMGYRISGEQNTVEISLYPGTIVRGHMDAAHCIDPNGEDRILEVKSMSQRVWDEWQKWGFERFTNYAAQITIYMAAQGAQATYAIINRETGELDVFNLTEFPTSLGRIADKIGTAEVGALTGVLPVCDGSAKSPCPWSFMCDKEEMLFEELESAGERRILEIAEELDRLREVESEVKAEIEAERERLRVALAGREAVKVPGFSITNKPRVSKRLNTGRLKKAVGDLSEYYDETTSKPVLTVRRST